MWGDVHTSHLNFSHHILKEVFDGTFEHIVRDRWFFMVDVADVALAHILAFEDPAAEGRYLTASGKLHMADLCALLRTEVRRGGRTAPSATPLHPPPGPAAAAAAAAAQPLASSTGSVHCATPPTTPP